jgi:hypothetical protein
MPTRAATASNIIRNIIGSALAAYGFEAFFLFLIVTQQWVHLAPTEETPARGLMYMHNEHGVRFYFSAFQTTAFALMFYSSIPVFLLGLVVAPRTWTRAEGRLDRIRMIPHRDDPSGVSTWAFWVAAGLTPLFVFLVGPHIVQWLNGVGIVINLG